MTLYTLNSAGCQLDKTREKKNMIYLRTLTGASPEKTVCVCVCVPAFSQSPGFHDPDGATGVSLGLRQHLQCPHFPSLMALAAVKF